MRKSSLTILCASSFVFVLAGCGGSEPAPATTPAAAPAAKSEAKTAPSAGKPAAGKKSPGVEPESNTPARRRDKE